ncbi:MAG TPA: IS607 family transposase [Thermodesulfovibrionales bacterium]|nr:IS607 family transposase [Thermodesulfovibrionales bacterium]
MRVGIREAAETIGVSIDTLRRWEKSGKIKSYRTGGGHRRYDLVELGLVRRPDKIKKTTVAYARVSSHDQKKDLVRQVEVLSSFCAANGWTFEVLQDLGSGLNYNKKGLKALIARICHGQINRLVITCKDRLLRFGSELIFALCEIFNIEVVIINRGGEVSYEEELAQDVLEIITVFSARLYGARSHKNKKIVETLREVADEVCS